MSRFIETIRFENGEFHLLDYHQERVDRTFTIFYSGYTSIQIAQVLPEFFEDGKHKFRLEYDQENHQLSHAPYLPKTIEKIKIIETDLDYSFKFSKRSELQTMLDESKTDEIIIVKNGLITDSSYSNLAFFDGSDWWTPRQPLLTGVRRAHLLKKGKIKASRITKGDLSSFEIVSLINAMLDLGELVIPTKGIS